MAEIHVEPKKQASSSWIWIVLILLLAAAVIYYFMTRNSGNATDAATPPANTTGFIEKPFETSTIKELLLKQNAAMYLC